MNTYRLKIREGDIDILNRCDIDCNIVHPMMYWYDMATGLPIVCPGYILHLNATCSEHETFLKLSFGDRINRL